MNIGDKVRLLKGTEEGYIVSIKGNIVEVEIEDGFSIPVVKNEVVVVDRKEAESFDVKEGAVNAQNGDLEPQKDLAIKSGLYLAIAQEGTSDDQPIYLINQTEDAMLFSIGKKDKKFLIGMAYGVCKAHDLYEIGYADNYHHNGQINLHVQYILHQKKSRGALMPNSVDLSIKAAQLPTPVFVRRLEKSVSLISLDQGNIEIDADQIKTSMTEGVGQKENRKSKSAESRDHQIDLHTNAEELGVKENEILRYQIRRFEEAFDNALMYNARSLKIIHGIGAGVLRSEIHRILSKSKEVKFYEDADKDKFGYGATIVYFQ